ncbi:hypothetical protein WJX72_010494 [[Myrmecia] bisecta]|uniref:Nitrate reductase [NADH] n=1 Tax=[Myrmecia] bisecta TaxID=41462 RepID=A0AAW1PD50_9CHLO
MAPLAVLQDDSAHGAGVLISASPKAVAERAVHGLKAARQSLDGKAAATLAEPTPVDASDAHDTKPEEPPLSREDPAWAQHMPVAAIDKKDADTPDQWVPRHPDLIRLTGRHPFNVEPPRTTELGFITPASLHYVRNHGAVPKINWEDHRLTVTGLVDNPSTFNMAQLIKLCPVVTITTLLTCAGNRRKEQNMVKKTIGFNWGPSGTSCGHWTGVRLCDVLRHCGIRKPGQGAKYVCFRGPKAELPQGKDGTYGTSLTYTRAMDPSNDIILAWKHNGRLLTPDHGYPLRIIIPGFIGGRMVKWLEEISVTSQESDNFYHYHDNRVLPSHVDDVTAKAEGWCQYSISGYAYTGGGRNIIRCEVSLDNGKSWRLADITQQGEPNEYGKIWTWFFWSLPVSVVELLKTQEIICRAWDESMNTQPDNFTWNAMGMMNNCVYRVKVHPVATKTGGMALQFEHPTIAGPTVGGWMNRADKVQPVVEAPKATVLPPTGKLRSILMEEVERHDSRESAWFVRGGKVYNGTAFLQDHPGGADSILLVAGTDATDEFDAIHSDKAKKQLLQYCIGELATAKPALTNGHANGHANGAVGEEALMALNPKKRIAFKLVEKHEVSHNTRRFRFALQSPNHKFGLPVGKHVFLYAKVNDELVMRAYTPTSSDDDLGYFDLVVKIYWANEHPRFPDGGKMSQHLESLAVGDEMEVKGPLGHFHYLGKGRYTNDGALHQVKHISMIAGGTGITPMYQVIKAVLKDADDNTQLSLLYANQSPDDILLWDELEEMAEDKRFKIWYTVDRPTDDWKYSAGFINEDMVQDHLFSASPDTICVMCGPPPMIKFACLPNLEKLGYKLDSQCIAF